MSWAVGTRAGDAGGDPGTGAVEMHWALQQSCGSSGTQCWEVTSKRGSRAALGSWAVVSEAQKGAETPQGHLQLLPHCPRDAPVGRGCSRCVLQHIPTPTPPILDIPLLPAGDSQGRESFIQQELFLCAPSTAVLFPKSQGQCSFQPPSTERWPGCAWPGRVTSLLPWIQPTWRDNPLVLVFEGQGHGQAVGKDTEGARGDGDSS